MTDTPPSMDPLWRSSLAFNGREALSAQRRANDAQREADEAAARLRASLLSAVGAGIDLTAAVRSAGVFGDAEGELTLTERHAIAEQLELAVKESVWPPGIEIREGRPGESWVFDGDGIPPDGRSAEERVEDEPGLDALDGALGEGRR